MYIFNLQDQLFLPHRSCDISFTLNPGEALVFTGENGVGKSTLMQNLSIQRHDISFLEQKPLEFFYDRKLSRVYHYVIGLRGVNKLRFERVWRDLQLHLKEDRTLSQLSGGEGQALKIALALAKEANIFLLDEPSQYLDSLKKHLLLQLLLKIAAEGKSLLVVEHDVEWLPLNWKKIMLRDEHGCLKGDE